MSSKTNCPNCGAPITGDVCEYCGTRHGITVFVPASPPPTLHETLTMYTVDGEIHQFEHDYRSKIPCPQEAIIQEAEASRSWPEAFFARIAREILSRER